RSEVLLDFRFRLSEDPDRNLDRHDRPVLPDRRRPGDGEGARVPRNPGVVDRDSQPSPQLPPGLEGPRPEDLELPGGKELGRRREVPRLRRPEVTRPSPASPPRCGLSFFGPTGQSSGPPRCLKLWTQKKTSEVPMSIRKTAAFVLALVPAAGLSAA